MAWGRGPLTGDQTNGWRDGGWETEAKCDRLAREGRETAASKAHHTFRRSSDEQRVGLGDPASPSSRKRPDGTRRARRDETWEAGDWPSSKRSTGTWGPRGGGGGGGGGGGEVGDDEQKQKPKQKQKPDAHADWTLSQRAKLPCSPVHSRWLGKKRRRGQTDVAKPG